jgi:hypothetical protein
LFGLLDGKKKGVLSQQDPGGNLLMAGGSEALAVKSALDELRAFLWLHFIWPGVKGTWNKCEKIVKSYFLNETVKQHPLG